MARGEGRRPGSDPGLLILISLAAGPRHGHGMLRDIVGFSGVHLGPGTLYGAIERLEREGLIEALPPEARRTPYRLTPEGSDHLRRRSADLMRLAAVARERVTA